MLALPPGKSAESAEFAKLHENLQLLELVGTDDCPYKEGGKLAYAEKLQGRCFTIMQYTHYNGVEIFSLEQVQRACAKKGMTLWAYIVHDADTYSEEDIANGHAPEGAQVGDLKPAHVHIVVLRKSQATLASVARAFGVPPQNVDVKSVKAYPYLCEYLTHEHPDQEDKGKHLYDRDEVASNDSDIWAKVDKLKDRRKQQVVSLTDLFVAVSKGEMTPDDVRRDHREIYVQPKVLPQLKKLRADHLRHRPLPSRVVNVLITGKGGLGLPANRGHVVELPSG